MPSAEGASAASFMGISSMSVAHGTTTSVSVAAISGESLGTSGPLHWLQYLLVPTIVGLGVAANFLALVVYVGSRLRRLSCSIYLAALAVSDSGFLLCLLTRWAHRVWISSWMLCPVNYYLTGVFSFLSMSYVLGYTVERYLATCWPLKRKTWCTKKRAVTMVAASLVFALIVFIPTLLMFEVRAITDDLDLHKVIIHNDSSSSHSIQTAGALGVAAGGVVLGANETQGLSQGSGGGLHAYQAATARYDYQNPDSVTVRNAEPPLPSGPSIDHLQCTAKKEYETILKYTSICIMSCFWLLPTLLTIFLNFKIIQKMASHDTSLRIHSSLQNGTGSGSSKRGSRRQSPINAGNITNTNNTDRLSRASSVSSLGNIPDRWSATISSSVNSTNNHSINSKLHRALLSNGMSNTHHNSSNNDKNSTPTNSTLMGYTTTITSTNNINNNSLSSYNSSSSSSSQHRRASYKITRMLVISSSAFIVMGLPYEILKEYHYFSFDNWSLDDILNQDRYSTTYKVVVFFVYHLYYLNYGVDFFIYNVAGKNFRLALSEVMRDLVGHVMRLVTCRQRHSLEYTSPGITNNGGSRNGGNRGSSSGRTTYQMTPTRV